MIGVIADDITGAAELGAIGLRFGLRAELLLEGPIVHGADLICIESDSRSCPPAEAGRRAASAAERLRAAGAEWIYKKVDSVLRGQVLAEVEAIRKQLGAARVLLGPANPSLGRTLQGGRYFVRGTPLHETDFRLDPEFPRTVSEVSALLGPGDIRICRPGEPLPSRGVAVAEVGNGEEVMHWANRVAPDVLPAGAAEFFGALLSARGHSPGKAPAMPDPGSELFVCGSASESTRRFINASRNRGVPVFGLSRELACASEPAPVERDLLAREAATELTRHRRVVLALDLPPLDRKLGPAMAGRLAEVALAVLACAPAAQVFAEGGATAACLARRAGWHRLEVVHEYAQGVVGTLTPTQPSRRFALKPGSYAWPDQEPKEG
jgi:uncharacterized protein YgbK (DUF1537 family)